MSLTKEKEKKNQIQAPLNEGDQTTQTLSPPPLQFQEGPDGIQTPTGDEKAAPAQTPGETVNPAPADTVASMLAETPSTNQQYADWVLRASEAGIGFVEFLSLFNAKENWERIRDGEKLGSVNDPHQEEILKSLPTVHHVVKARMQRYVDGGEKGAKETLTLGSFMIDRGTSHGSGSAIDMNGIDFTGDVAPIITLLNDLPSNIKGIGLPAQGKVFDPEKNISTLKTKAAANPVPGTVEGYQKFSSGVYKSTYGWLNADGTLAKELKGTETEAEKEAMKDKKLGWSKDVSAGGKAFKKYILSTDLITALEKVTTNVYCDNNNHIHVHSS
ncbi:MAG: hypothetical protein H6581_13250 [Bacteroidia bacterium]|nr:hypothetical protein [Bacteroidia bacterium]